MIPKYEIAKQAIIKQIENNHFAPNSKLPNSKELCKQLGVSDITLRRALLELSEQGNVIRVNGKGTFVTKRKMPKIDTEKVFSILLIVPTLAGNEFYADIVSGVSKEISNLPDYDLILCNSLEDPRKEIEYLKRSHNTDGIILVSYNSDMEFYSVLRETVNALPIVVMDVATDAINADYITTNDKQAMNEAVNYLSKEGCNNICLLLKESNGSTMIMRGEGYRNAVAANNLDENIIVSNDNSQHDGSAYNAIMAELAKTERPDAIIASTEWLAKICYRAILDSGLKMPEDIRLLSFGTKLKDEFRNVEISGIVQPTEEMGSTAVSLLIDKIEGRRSRFACRENILNSKLIIKET